MPWLQGSGIKLDKWGLIQTGDVGYLPTQTHLKKVFAGGDAVHGADLVVTAMKRRKAGGARYVNSV